MNLQRNTLATPTLSVVSAQKMDTTVHPESPDRLGPRVLEMMGHLQTSLEICQQIKIFAAETGKISTFSGVSYSNDDETHSCSFGDLNSHSASYTLIVNEENLGKINFYRSYAFENSEMELFENMLCGLIYPLRNALMYHTAITAATTDPLTGVYNRTAYDQAIKREYFLSRRNATPLSLLVIDIDHFKRVNDNYGHTMGDAALQAVANTIQKTIRETDILFRYGGEEFVVLLSNTATEGAGLLAERVREEIDKITHITSIEMFITVSVGGTELQSSDEKPEALFSRADKALYEAKETGRNKVIIG